MEILYFGILILELSCGMWYRVVWKNEIKVSVKLGSPVLRVIFS
jgi:hypothetical protein